MQRRIFLAGAALLLGAGHTPYQQWVIYRKRTLLIGSCRSDRPTYELAERIAAILAEHLPKSRARLSRAPNYERLASLLGTAQLDVAVLARPQASAMVHASAPFEGSDPLPLRSLFDLEDYVLVGRADFPARHAFLVSRTLDQEAAGIAGAIPEGSDASDIPPHAGTAAYARGAPLPAPPAAAEPAAHGHEHAD